MSEDIRDVGPIQPPADVPGIQRGNWLTLPLEDPLVEYVAHSLWDRVERPAAWEAARLSQAAYVYREVSTGWTVVAKFYAVKAGSSAPEYAAREFECIRRAQQASVAGSDARAIEPLALWRGALFLEYVDGLTLEDIIAVRRSQPGGLADALKRAAGFLATLHVHSLRPDAQPDFGPAVKYAQGVVEQLAKHGILHDCPIARDGISRLIDRWAANLVMEAFRPSLTHGDATTTNFVYPRGNGVVVVDWERLHLRDPAFDLGRLMAEATHSISQHGGSVVEARPFVQHLVDAYRRSLPEDWDSDSLLRRARFYRASSTLRIARNGWVSRLDRTALVAQAMALLTHEP